MIIKFISGALLLLCLIVIYWLYKDYKMKNAMHIAYMGNPILYQHTKDITDLHTSEVAQMAVKLKNTLTAMQATGFAAPQLLSPLRMMVISVSAKRAQKFGYKGEIPTTVLINPNVKPLCN